MILPSLMKTMTHYEKINSLILSLFSSIPEVTSIYRTDTYDGSKVWIFTGNQRYDDALMDDMVECEIIVRSEHKDTLFDFRYILVGTCGTPGDAVDVYATEIYSR